MKDEYLWRQLKKNKKDFFKCLIKEFIIISPKKFQKFKKYFKNGKNIFHKKYLSYRTDGWFKHLHAKVYKNKVDIHYDHGNLDKCILLWIIHFFVDYIPYQIFLIKKNIKKKI